MKKIFLLTIAMFALAALCAAQYGGQSSMPQQQNPSPSMQGQPGSQPQQPAPGAQPQQPGAQPSAEPQKKTAPTAKTKAEYDAYMAAVQEPDPTKAELAAKDFETKFPDSQLRSPLYHQLIGRYQQANNDDKALEMARKAVQIDPDAAVALITISNILAGTSRPSDLNWQQKYDEAVKDSNHAIQLIETGAFAPPQASKPQLNAAEAQAYAAIGTLDFNNKNDVAAEKSLRKAVELNTVSPDPTAWLRLAVALDHQQKYKDALDAANHAVQYSASDPRVLNLASQEQTRLKQLTGAPTSKAVPPASSAPSGAKPPAPPASGPGASTAPPATTPH
jgi:Tfp pilus assembly protein PilF